MRDKHSLYELSVQNPTRDVRLLSAIHGGAPQTLGEDFSGTAALSGAWLRLGRARRAIAVDHDAITLARAPRSRRLARRAMDVLSCIDRVDVLAVLNFSIGYFHRRRDCLRYMRHAVTRLRSGGCLVCDLYAGVDSHVTGRIHQSIVGPHGERIRSTWEQRTADPLTGRVCNVLHFRVTERSGKVQVLRDAFIYDWRLWSPPELTDLMLEAGFASVQVYPRFADATDSEGNYFIQPVADPSELGDSFSCYIVGRTSD